MLEVSEPKSDLLGHITLAVRPRFAAETVMHGAVNCAAAAGAQKDTIDGLRTAVQVYSTPMHLRHAVSRFWRALKYDKADVIIMNDLVNKGVKSLVI